MFACAQKLPHWKWRTVFGTYDIAYEHFLLGNLWIWYTKSLGFYEKLRTLISCNFLSFGNQITNQKSGITSSPSSLECARQILRISKLSRRFPGMKWAQFGVLARAPPYVLGHLGGPLSGHVSKRLTFDFRFIFRNFWRQKKILDVMPEVPILLQVVKGKRMCTFKDDFENPTS